MSLLELLGQDACLCAQIQRVTYGDWLIIIIVPGASDGRKKSFLGYLPTNFIFDGAGQTSSGICTMALTMSFDVTVPMCPNGSDPIWRLAIATLQPPVASYYFLVRSSSCLANRNRFHHTCLVDPMTSPRTFVQSMLESMASSTKPQTTTLSPRIM